MVWLRFIVRRLGTAVVLLVVVSGVLFAVLRIIPGDPTTTSARPGFTEEDQAAVLHQLGLDRPLWEQYAEWVSGVLHGDFGESYFSGFSSTRLIVERVPVTLELTFATLLLAVPISTAVALAAVRRPGGLASRVASGLSSIGLAMPPFWLGILLLLLFAVHLGWLAARGYVRLSVDPVAHFEALILPTITLTFVVAAPIYRFLRAAVDDETSADYIRTAYGKGLSQKEVLRRHALLNASLPTLNFVGLLVGSLLGGVVAVEYVFGLPGLGALAIDAVSKRDYSVLQGVVLLAVFTFVVISLLVDLVSLRIDPRLRAETTRR